MVSVVLPSQVLSGVRSCAAEKVPELKDAFSNQPVYLQLGSPQTKA
jgi:hypothetical protein